VQQCAVERGKELMNQQKKTPMPTVQGDGIGPTRKGGHYRRVTKVTQARAKAQRAGIDQDE
jgi:hypothetical protein